MDDNFFRRSKNEQKTSLQKCRGHGCRILDDNIMYVLDVYLYIVFPHLLGDFPAYLHTCTYTIYVAFGPYGIQLVYS
jgi:hypothetical protein